MRGIRKQVFSDKNYQPSTIIADAGADISVTDIGDVALDGTGSSTTDGGGITAYFWEILLGGEDNYLTTPTLSTTGMAGGSIVGNISIRLTVFDATGNSASDIVSVSVEALPPPLTITAGIINIDREGVIDFTNGEPNEVLSLEFKLFNYNSGDYVEIKDELGVDFLPMLDSQHPTRFKNLTLDGSGEYTLDFKGFVSGFQMRVKITGRSSSEEIPTPDSITIYF